MGLGITWAIAFLLTEAGAYSYKDCDINVPTSNIISDSCRKHVSRMKHCRVDTSHALKASPWFRFPYPLQWGTPVFHWKMALVMCAVSLITSVDSVSFCTLCSAHPDCSSFKVFLFYLSFHTSEDVLVCMGDMLFQSLIVILCFSFCQLQYASMPLMLLSINM